MAEITLMKLPGGYFIPATEQDKQLADKIKTGHGITVQYKKKRLLWMHRKFFALLNLGFDNWEPEELEYNGMPVEKNFERFRKDIIIAAGFYTLVTNLKGETRAEAKSISFGRMDEQEFDALYYAAVDVLIKYVLKRYSRDDVDRVVNELVQFAH